jgi:hypothetical protein
MKTKNDCEIVQDLLPNYIENLTTESSNTLIENHLETCEDCKNILENMKKNITIKDKPDKKEINYMKKFSNKMIILETIILIIIILFILIIARKFIILKTIYNKQNNYIDSTNFQYKNTIYAEDTIITLEWYRLNNKFIEISTLGSGTDKKLDNIISYYNGDSYNRYIECFNANSSDIYEKTAYLNCKNDFNDLPSISSAFWIEDTSQLITLSIFSSITSETFNEKPCYRIIDRSLGTTSNIIYYIDKETGLLMRKISDGYEHENGTSSGNIIDFTYKFDCVTEDDFIEPDINEYQINN